MCKGLVQIVYKNSRNLKEGRIIKKADDYRNENDIKTANKGQIPGGPSRPESEPGQNRSHVRDKLWRLLYK